MLGDAPICHRRETRSRDQARVTTSYIRRDLQLVEVGRDWQFITYTTDPTICILCGFLEAHGMETPRGRQRGAPRYGGRGALKRERWCMTRNPNILLALARQGYSHRTIAEIAGVTPDALRSLIGSSPYDAVCPRRTHDRRFERRVRFGVYPIG